MRCCLVFILAIGITASSWADDAKKAQIEAATANAISHIMADHEADQITPDITVAAFLTRTASRPRMLDLLDDSAEQIGGPRWLDDQTCQVLINVPGRKARQALQQIIKDNPDIAPVDDDTISKGLKGWDKQVFSATGTSIARLDAVRPPPDDAAWNGRPQDAVSAALTAARQDAVNQVLTSISAVPLTKKKTIADALDNHDVADELANWVGNRPVMLVDFRDDQTVAVTLSLSPDSLAVKVRSVLEAHPKAPAPDDDAGWAAVTAAISRSMAMPTGIGKLSGPTQATVSIVLPTQPPDWVDRQLDADGSGAGDNELVASHAAEAAALAKIRAQLDALPIGDGKTLADAAKEDGHLAAIIDRTIDRSAHVYNVDDHGDGTVTVRMSFDLRELWQAIYIPH